MIRLDPPGTFCQTAAVCDALDRNARTFVDVGCGIGTISRELCRRGLSGLGIDVSAEAIAITREHLATDIADRRYDARVASIHELREGSYDVAISMMVAEHMEDDTAFVSSVARLVEPGGQVIIGVPGRRDHWGYEDEVVGHKRRYEREDLERLLRSAGLEDVRVWSVAVPVANLLFHVGNSLVRRSTTSEMERQPPEVQTAHSGTREVPWKTVFPSWCRVVLNRYALYPLFVLQRLFYRSRLGITLIASGRVPRR
jgi:SAM-dependent methyltransferase